MVGGSGRPGASLGVLSFSLRSPLIEPSSVIDVAYWPIVLQVARRLFECGIATLRYQFPYMEARIRRPDPLPLSRLIIRRDPAAPLHGGPLQSFYPIASRTTFDRVDRPTTLGPEWRF